MGRIVRRQRERDGSLGTRAWWKGCCEVCRIMFQVRAAPTGSVSLCTQIPFPSGRLPSVYKPQQVIGLGVRCRVRVRRVREELQMPVW